MTHLRKEKNNPSEFTTPNEGQIRGGRIPRSQVPRRKGRERGDEHGVVFFLLQ